MDSKKKRDFIKNNKEVLEEIFSDRIEHLKNDIFQNEANLTEQELRLKIKLADEAMYWTNIIGYLSQKSQSKDNYR